VNDEELSPPQPAAAGGSMARSRRARADNCQAKVHQAIGNAIDDHHF
jgi:hypothetical protein